MANHLEECPSCGYPHEGVIKGVIYFESYFSENFQQGWDKNADIDVAKRYQVLLSKLPEDPQISRLAEVILSPEGWHSDFLSVEDTEIGLAVFQWLESCPEFFLNDCPILRFEIVRFVVPIGEVEIVYCNGGRKSGADLERIIAQGLDVFLAEKADEYIRLAGDEEDIFHE